MLKPTPNQSIYIYIYLLRGFAIKGPTKVDISLKLDQTNQYVYKEDLALDLQGLICHKTKPNQTTLYMYKKDLVLNDLQGLICHKNKPNQPIYIYMHKKIWC